MVDVRRPLIIIVALCISTLGLSAQEDAPGSAASEIPALNVWLPAPLISDESGAAFQLLSEHTASFSQANGIAVSYRIKGVGSVGGIIATIRAGKDVAPGALPDVTLIRRRDFTPTQASQFFQSMETLFSSSLINDLDDGLEFGQIPLEGEVALYGLPYLFDLLLTVYTRPLANVDTRLRFEDVLSSGANFTFPAARTNGLNQTFYLQYLSASGLGASDGVITVDEDALKTVLQFYQDLVDADLISPDVLTYQTPDDYISDFANQTGQLQMAVFTVSDYLAMVDQQVANLLAADIPTADGDNISIRDGWLWVIVTPDRSRRAVAARFLEWMMEPAFHAAFAGSLHHLPAQPAVLEASLPATVDRQFIVDLLSNATLPLPEGEGGTTSRLMQEALIDVLHGDASAAAAARRVVSQDAER